MSTTLKLRGGSTAEHSTFTGEAREVTVDTQKNTVVVHDGTTAGGHPLVKESSLGTAATSDVTTSATDTTSGRLLKVGDFGLGKSVITVSVDIDQLDSLNYTTFARLSQAIGGQLDSESKILHIEGGNSATQYASRRGSATERVRFRLGNSTSDWTQWQIPFNTGNILGPVSQSGGVPTGAIIQRGSNANGEFVRYADGTMICTKKTTHNFSTANRTDHNYPASFASEPSCSISFRSTNNSDRWVVYESTFIMGLQAVWSVVNQETRAETLGVLLTAIGRWY